uniref:recombination-associated protein RdgC n=1 Tax=Halomonas sp. EAR18 TaxID=2518972 RepID=UPI001443A0A1|nr:recombination-associated protein RdgC [Halomonas sp. EAR18]
MRADEREAAEGQPLSRRERQLLKEQVLEELLPQAFTRTQRIDVWWDTRNRIIGINTGSKRATCKCYKVSDRLPRRSPGVAASRSRRSDII